jgi:hypothetical protein
MTGPWAGLVRLWSVALVISGAGLGTPVAAQGTLPENPPELKDFRLDTPKPREDVPQPQPQPQPKAETPAAQPEPVRQQPAPNRADPVRTAPDTPPTSNNERPTSKPVAPTETESAKSVLVLPDAPATDGATAPMVDLPAGNSLATNWQTWLAWWPILAVLLAALLAYGLFRLLQKRVADSAARVASPAALQPAPMPVRKTPPLPTKPAASLTARFETGDARLSLANLTITGQLHLSYAGSIPLEGIAMRTRVMSACEGQAAIIDAFHDDQRQGDREVLGNMQPGENITLKLQLQVPRDALSAFDWRERRFVAPIVLVNIASDGADVAPCRLSCVVGQPSAADSRRLMPIPIDRGPKRFDTVQFQPIAA